MTMTSRDSYALNSGALAIGTTTTKAKTAAAINFVIAGRALTKAATDDLFTLTGTALAANQVCAFFLYLDASGTASIAQSAIKTASTVSTGIADAFEWPEPDAKAVVGALLIKSAGSAFTPGTTALTSVTTYINAGPEFGTPITY
jgi:hypothetical protein